MKLFWFPYLLTVNKYEEAELSPFLIISDSR